MDYSGIFLVNIVLLGLCVVSLQAQKTSVDGIRLSGNGATSRKGRVEILMNGQWGTICSNNFDSQDRDVLCGMLGFEKTPSVTIGISVPGSAGLSTPIHMSELGCVGTEANIDQCRSVIGNDRITSCNHAKDVAIECQGTVLPSTTTSTTTTPTPPPTVCTTPSKAVRLVDGPNSAIGRVEILQNNVWGIICDDRWGTKEATVICRMLCYPQSDAHALGRLYGDPTGMKIWLDRVQCTGTETSITDCKHPGWGINNCNQKEAAAVSCLIDKPTLPKGPSPTVQCEADMIGVYFSRQEEPRLLTDHLTVGQSSDPKCGFTRGVTSTHVFIKIPYANCGTKRSNNATSIIYTNVVTHAVPSEKPIITRTNTYTISVNCVMDRHSNKDKNLEPEPRTVPAKTSTGEFNMQMLVYDNPDFKNPQTKFPVQLLRGQIVYVGVMLYTKDEQLKTVVPNCVTTAHVSRDSKPSYDLIKDKCRLDQTVTFYPVNETFYGFSFQTFAFSPDTDSTEYPYVYLHCDGIVCEMDEKNKQCDRSCNGTSRRRRSISLHSKHIYHFDKGPFLITPSGNEKLISEENKDGKVLPVSDTASPQMIWSIRVGVTSLLLPILLVH